MRGDVLQAVGIDIPQVAAHVAVPHASQQVEISAYLVGVFRLRIAELEVHDDGLSVAHHHAVGAACLCVPFLIACEDGAFVVEFP